jgi:hypothetical protein
MMMTTVTVSAVTLATYLACMIAWAQARTISIKRAAISVAAISLALNVATAAYSLAMA